MKILTFTHSFVFWMLSLLSPMAILAQNISLQNGNFDQISGWEIVGKTGSIEAGRYHILKGSESKIFQRLSVSEGSYLLTAKVSIPNCEGKCYLYGKGDGYTMVSTEIPKVKEINQSITVYVRGVQTKNGNIEIGVYNEGKHDIYIDEISLAKENSPYSFLQGGDITELNYVINSGGNYSDENGMLLYDKNDSDDKKAQAVVDYLAKKGMNFVRIRNSNSPGKMMKHRILR